MYLVVFSCFAVFVFFPKCCTQVRLFFVSFFLNLQCVELTGWTKNYINKTFHNNQNYKKINKKKTSLLQNPKVPICVWAQHLIYNRGMSQSVSKPGNRIWRYVAGPNFPHLLIISHDMKILGPWQDHLCQILCLTPITSHIIIHLLQSKPFPYEESI